MTLIKLMSICFYMAIGILTIYMASFVRTEKTVTSQQKALNKTYLAGIFLVLFVCSALRFEVGNDYTQYVYTAHEAAVGGYVVTEPGFNYLVRFIYLLFGGEYYEIIFALFAFVTIWIFLKAMYEQSEAFSISFFLFMTLGLYFQTYNTVRYYFALAIALFCMQFVLNKDYVRFVFWILIASLFHKSVLLVIPVYMLASFVWKKSYIIFGLFVSALCFIFKKPLLAIALKLYPSYKNTVYLDTKISILSIVKPLLAIMFYLWYLKKSSNVISKETDKSEKIRFYAQLNMLALDVSVFFSFLPVVTRITYYFSVSQLLLIPAIIAELPNQKDKKKAEWIILITCAIYFVLFLYQADKPGVGLIPYKTWVFSQNRILCK